MIMHEASRSIAQVELAHATVAVVGLVRKVPLGRLVFKLQFFFLWELPHNGA